MSNLREIVYQAIGEASVCWAEPPRGVFDSDSAKAAGDRIIAAFDREHREHLELMQWSRYEIGRLRADNQHMATRLQMFDDMMLLFRSQPSNVGFAQCDDPYGRLEKALAVAQAEEERK
jgi:hypothetical protein